MSRDDSGGKRARKAAARPANVQERDLKADLRTALDLLTAMLNEDGASDLNWDSPPLKGTVGWEIRQLVKKYKGKL